MSKLEELINELCPDGVEYKPLGELGEFYGGLSGKSKEDFTEGNAKLITYMNIFTNLSLNIDVNDNVKIGENEKQNTVQYGDILFTGSSETPEECGMSSVLTTKTDELLFLNSFCFGFRPYEKESLLPDFSKYLFRSEELRKQIKRTASGVTRFNVSKKKMAQVVIPLPPLPVQREIVRILDNFTELAAELTAELTARKKQYEYYRDELLTFSDESPVSILGTVAINLDSKRKPVTKGNRDSGMYPYYGASGIVDYVSNYLFDGDYLLVSEDGANLVARVTPIAFSASGKIWVNNHAHVLMFKTYVERKFVEYYLNMIDLSRFISTAAQPKLTQDNLNKIPVPTPSLEEQERIVAILDRFDALCNDLTSGLPAEIEARRKQYEYYRDRILTFKEKVA
ncbi:MAG: restriction endonuclease subunit S [Synergistaceae bacterium]|nr:restriction endonuclease subunit S [Synergistaceae bacterium]